MDALSISNPSIVVTLVSMEPVNTYRFAISSATFPPEPNPLPAADADIYASDIASCI